MTYKQEMARYRSRFGAKQTKRGKRRHDFRAPQFWDAGLFWDLLALALVGLTVVLASCARGAL